MDVITDFAFFEPLFQILDSFVGNWLQSYIDMDFAINKILLIAAIQIPILSALVLLIFGKISDKFVKNLAVIAFFIPAIIACWLWSAYNIVGSSGFAYFSDTYTGLELFGISLKLGLNGISLPLFVLAALVGLAAGLYAVYSVTDNLRHYLTLLLLMHGGLMGIFASIDIFFFYFFHELALIPTFIMIARWGGPGRRSAAIEMTIYLTLGALLSLIGLIGIYLESGLGSFDIISLRKHLAEFPLSEITEKYLFGLLLFGFGILVSLWPFHSWAPRGYGSAPTSAAMLHAGVLKKFGLYGIIQIGAPLLPIGATQWTNLLLFLALGNIIIIGFVTLAQKDLKQLIGYSSVMHMGYAFLGIVCLSTIGIGGAVLIMFAHGLSISLLFLLSTCIYKRSNTLDMRQMGGLATKAPVLAFFFIAAILAGIGLPGFANFWGEITVFIGLWQYKPILVFPAILGIVLSAIYGLRAISSIFYGPIPESLNYKLNSETSVADSKQENQNESIDLNYGEKMPAAILLVTLVIVGFWPKSISDFINGSVVEIYPKSYHTKTVSNLDNNN